MAVVVAEVVVEEGAAEEEEVGLPRVHLQLRTP